MSVTRKHIPVIRRTLSLLVGWLLLVNGMMFGFMHAPVALAAVPTSTTASEVTYVPLIICTANGIKTISVPAEVANDGATAPHSSNAYEGFQCASCGLGNHAVGMPVEPELPDVQRVKLSNQVTALHITARLHDFCPIAASPRAPPALI
ncbi:DUF2946 family protein [Thalassospira sp. SM2505]|uniref:DUF2946 domain-containing protein n=1 Tax=Thalassospira profundimaris TaxID=502049 RepID=A0A367WWR5_9PROT|nr:DUF2946 family protein [Thalassospira profundimaris]RCK45110.1 hypothetical protein TH30_13990 [Thalassospira profundimaris]